MSVNRNMKKCMLQINRRGQSLPSGAVVDRWEDDQEISVAIYKKDDLRVFANEKYIESTHTGLTYHKGAVADKHRLVRDGVIYNITASNTDGRLAVLLLKVVDDNAG